MSGNRHERRRAGALGLAGPSGAPSAPSQGGARGLIDLAVRLRDSRDPVRALDLCRQAAALEPGNPEIPFTAATICETMRDLPNAIAAYRRVLALKPGFLPALVNCAACLADLGELPESIELYQQALQADPNSLPLRQNLAQLLMQLKRPRDAAVHFKRLAAVRGGPLDFTALADALDQAGEPEQAMASYREAMARRAPPAPTHVMMARVELVRGGLDAAREHLKEALAADPSDGHAHHVMANNFAGDGGLEARIDAAERALAAANGKPIEIAEAPLRFALGRLYDKAGHVDDAFRHFSAGNALFARRQAEEDARLEARVRRAMAEYTPGSIGARRDWGHGSEQPVFLFGLPRSGTTLLEQMLSSHRDVAGLGETDLIGWMAGYLRTLTEERVKRAAGAYLAAYPAGARGKARVIDKSLGSYTELGLLVLMFPKARFINVERHPMDVAFSAWSHYFATNAIVYAYSFDRLARHMRLYAEAMDHWRKAFPDRIHHVRYEDLVDAPEPTARAAVAHLGLDWDPSCLAFQETAREVRTASISQVRQPIYRSSLGHWKKYERHLRPLADALKDMIEEYDAGFAVRGPEAS